MFTLTPTLPITVHYSASHANASTAAAAAATLLYSTRDLASRFLDIFKPIGCQIAQDSSLWSVPTDAERTTREKIVFRNRTMTR
ncbi:hypothetical protein CGLO_16723 [Colletotrichum gloeosporioides Cg-14]|uniref:Uncharacterized protein n=1 Tax=Colletotrichum gloeosporioides (strain Cg-14) TaxID=1237896 RepID=T0L8N6_COLGC|nr:hypothetical protein CGLO_16723 [Colletotrichum gloeosporioides Cg-14]